MWKPSSEIGGELTDHFVAFVLLALVHSFIANYFTFHETVSFLTNLRSFLPGAVGTRAPLEQTSNQNKNKINQ